jgi:hypothetical protein
MFVLLSGSEYVLSYPKYRICLNFIGKLIFTIKKQHRIYPALCLHLPHLSAATVEHKKASGTLFNHAQH